MIIWNIRGKNDSLPFMLPYNKHGRIDTSSKMRHDSSLQFLHVKWIAVDSIKPRKDGFSRQIDVPTVIWEYCQRNMLCHYQWTSVTEFSASVRIIHKGRKETSPSRHPWWAQRENSRSLKQHSCVCVGHNTSKLPCQFPESTRTRPLSRKRWQTPRISDLLQQFFPINFPTRRDHLLENPGKSIICSELVLKLPMRVQEYPQEALTDEGLLRKRGSGFSRTARIKISL